MAQGIRRHHGRTSGDEQTIEYFRTTGRRRRETDNGSNEDKYRAQGMPSACRPKGEMTTRRRSSSISANRAEPRRPRNASG